MNPLVVLDRVSLAPQGPTVDLQLFPGQSVAVMGPPGSGKSRLIELLSKGGAPSQGRASLEGTGARSGFEPGRKLTPRRIAQSAHTGSSNALVAEALYSTNLHEFMDEPIESLSGSRLRACEVLPCLASRATVLLMDSVLDSLDIWTFERVWSLIRRRLSSGSACVISTHRAEVAARCDYLLLLASGVPRFLGEPEEFVESQSRSEIKVRTRSQKGVEAICDPFQIRADERKGEVAFSAPKGQELAARLLCEGYGDVEMVLLRKPTLAEALQSALR